MIRTKLFLGFAITIVIFGVTSAFIGIRLIRGRVVDEAQTRVRLDLNSAWSVYNAKLEEIETVLILTAGKRMVLEAFLAEDLPNSQVQNSLELIRIQMGLDFLAAVSTEGQVLLRTAPPYNTGDFSQSYTVVRDALKGATATGTCLLSGQELETEHQGLAEKAFLTLEDTPHARPTSRTVESRGMVIMGAVPVTQGNQVLGAMYGGMLLTRNNALVDRIQEIVFEDTGEKTPGGTVTVFLYDSRITTTVRLAGGNRALGTRVSKEVADTVLDNGKRWVGRAFVVNDWYLTAYDPIKSRDGKIIGMLYVGILERPFRELGGSILLRYGILSSAVLIGTLIFSFFFAGRIALPLHNLANAAVKMQSGESPSLVESDKASKETRELIDAFNAMAKALAEREAKLKEANVKLEEANVNLKSLNLSYMETVGFISHELKGPLATIMMYIFLIKEKKLGSLTEKQEKAVKNVDGNVHRLVEMVRHYLNLSRIENGELEPIQTRVNIQEEVLAPLVESYAEQAGGKEMKILNRIDSDVVLYADLNCSTSGRVSIIWSGRFPTVFSAIHL